MTIKKASKIRPGDVILNNHGEAYLILDKKPFYMPTRQEVSSPYAVAGFIALHVSESTKYRNPNDSEFSEDSWVISTPKYALTKRFPEGEFKILLKEGFVALLGKAEEFHGGTNYDPDIEVVGTIAKKPAYDFVLDTVIEFLSVPELKLAEAELEIDQHVQQLQWALTPEHFTAAKREKARDIANLLNEDGDLTIEDAFETGLITAQEIREIKSFEGGILTHIRQAKVVLDDLIENNPSAIFGGNWGIYETIQTTNITLDRMLGLLGKPPLPSPSPRSDNDGDPQP